MVSVLGIDSSGNGCSAAILCDGRIAARRLARMARGQAEALMPMIEAVLREAALSVAALDLIAVTTGPGAFTGLRIGLAAARGLALAGNVPALGITSFAAVAAQVAPAERAGRHLVVALDSKREEFFLQRFGADGEAEGAGALVAPADAARFLPAGRKLLAGDAAPRLAAALAGHDAAMASGAGVPDAADVARLAAARWQPGLHLPLPQPLYLRLPDTTVPRPAVAR